MTFPSQLMKQYERGVITRMELITQLVQLAADTSPEQVASLLPDDCLRGLKVISRHPPATPADAPRSFAIVMSVGATVSQADQQRQQRSWHDGAWSWHHYFQRAELIRGLSVGDDTRPVPEPPEPK